MNKPKYTFLVPAFKTDYFELSLLSMLNQSYSRFKIIVSDDCSPAPITEIVEKVEEKLPSTICKEQLIYRRNKENIGGQSLVKHWNLLVNLCDTDYLIMASDDDVYDKDFLYEINELVSKYPMSDLFCSRSQRINQNNTILAKDAPTEEWNSQVDFLNGLYFLHRIKCIGNYVFKTTALRQAGGFLDFPLAWGSDDATASLLSKNGVGITKEILFSFRLSGKNISTKIDKLIVGQKVRARMKNIEWFDKFIKTVETDGSLLERNRLNEYINFYLKEWVASVKAQSEQLNYREFKNAYKWLAQRNCFEGTLEKMHFLYTWIRANSKWIKI